jgi:ubiquinone/menaquinone biosynthesis C-methylase UbiE
LIDRRRVGTGKWGLTMGYVFDFQDSRAYAAWASQQCDQWSARMQVRLMLQMLHPASGESILDIGCGAGTAMQPLLELGLNVTGLDPSPYMLALCAEQLGNRVDLYRGVAEDLPFDDNSFNHAFFFISLEFVDDPIKAVEEACRVAKDRVFFGFLNRFALKMGQHWPREMPGGDLLDHARLFSVWELKKMVRLVAGPVPVIWRTVCQLSQSPVKMFQSIEQSQLVQRCPFGAFAGMVATLVPRFRTRPLAIRYLPEKGRRVVAGSVPAGTACIGEGLGRGGEPSPEVARRY